MTARGRRWAFAVAAAVVIAAAIVPGLIGSGGSPPDHGAEATRPGKPKATVQGAGAPPSRPGPADATEATVAARAEEFLRAFLRFEVGDGAPSVRATIERIAAPPLAAALLAEPPRPPAAGGFPAAGEFVRLESTERVAGGGFEAGALVRYGGQPGPLFLSIERKGGQWLVTAIG